MKKVIGIFLAIFLSICCLTFSTAQTANITVHYINVGQADSIFVQAPNGDNMLIDAGNNTDGKTVVSYLKQLGVKKINYVIITHPHADHEGGMDDVINNFTVGVVYAGTIFKDLKGKNITPTTQTHIEVLNAEKAKKLSPILPKAGLIFKMGTAVCTVIAPNSTSYNDINSFSIVIRMTFNKESWLFEGDADKKSEDEILLKKFVVKSDVLKISHHGSYTATSSSFINAISPKYAVLSVGRGNMYKHPHQITMDKLMANKIPLYRTDEEGTIICTSNGESVKFNVPPGDYANGDTIVQSTPSSTNAPTLKPTPEPKSIATSTPIKSPTTAPVPSQIPTFIYTATPTPAPAPTGTPASTVIVTPAPAPLHIETIVYITKTGFKYHRIGCRYLSKSIIPINLSDAKLKAYSPCSVCNP